VTGDILRFKRLAVCARKVGGDVVIGEGSVSLRAAGVEYSKAVTVVVKMKDKRGKPKGRIELIMQVDPSAKAIRAKKLATVTLHLPHLKSLKRYLLSSALFISFFTLKSVLLCAYIRSHLLTITLSSPLLLTSSSSFPPSPPSPVLLTHAIRLTLPLTALQRAPLTAPSYSEK
jgi:hypothetical protein